MPRPIVLDVDTGTDDALALLYAVGHPGLELLGVSCVAGNAGLDQVVDNTAKVLDAAGAGRSDRGGGDQAVASSGARPEGALPRRGRAGRDLLPATRPARPGETAVELLHERITTPPSPSRWSASRR